MLPQTHWLRCRGLLFIAAAAVSLLWVGRVLPSRDAAIAAAAGIIVIAALSLGDTCHNLLSAGENVWSGTLVLTIAFILGMYLTRTAITCAFERVYGSRLYHRIVDQDAPDDLRTTTRGEDEAGPDRSQ